MLVLVLVFPWLMTGLAALFTNNDRRPWLLPVTGTVQLAATLLLVVAPNLLPAPTIPVFALDAVGRLALLVVNLLFFVCSFYAVGYLRLRTERNNFVFCVCMIAFLGTTGLAACSQHLGLLWVSIEAATLVMAPLIYFNHTPQSLEATWKYLLVGFVGIALALLGTFCIAYAALHKGLHCTLILPDILAQAASFSPPWLKAGFLLLLVGYGTKMGLAPMHTWKPDAYGEAPGVVGALLSGGVTTCAFLALLRAYQVCVAAGVHGYATRLLLAIGIFSMIVAALFIIGQRDFKRMLAYSSVEHMGILALGLGVGSLAFFGALFHLLANSLAKGLLFLSAGNIHRAYGSKNVAQVSGVLQRLPLSGTLFLLAFFAITGTPLFAPFVGLFAILSAMLQTGRLYLAVLFLVLLLVVFIGMGATTLRMMHGRPGPEGERHEIKPYYWLTRAPLLVLALLLLFFGIYIPAPLHNLLADATTLLEVAP